MFTKALSSVPINFITKLDLPCEILSLLTLWSWYSFILKIEVAYDTEMSWVFVPCGCGHSSKRFGDSCCLNFDEVSRLTLNMHEYVPPKCRRWYGHVMPCSPVCSYRRFRRIWNFRKVGNCQTTPPRYDPDGSSLSVRIPVWVPAVMCFLGVFCISSKRNTHRKLQSACSVRSYFYTLKMQEITSFDTLVTVSWTTRRHIPDVSIAHYHRPDNLMSRKLSSCPLAWMCRGNVYLED